MVGLLSPLCAILMDESFHIDGKFIVSCTITSTECHSNLDRILSGGIHFSLPVRLCVYIYKILAALENIVVSQCKHLEQFCMGTTQKLRTEIKYLEKICVLHILLLSTLQLPNHSALFLPLPLSRLSSFTCT